MITCEIVMRILPQRSNGRLPTLSIVQMLVLTPTSWVILRTPDMISCMLWFSPIVSKRVGESTYISIDERPSIKQVKTLLFTVMEFFQSSKSQETHSI